MTNRNENATRTSAHLSADTIARATTALLATWDYYVADERPENAKAARQSIADQATGYRDMSADELMACTVCAAVGDRYGFWENWDDEDWEVWSATVTEAAKTWIATHQPDPTATLTITGEEAQALEEVCCCEADMCGNDCLDEDGIATANLLRAICQRLNTTEGMMTIGGTLEVTLAEAKAIANAIHGAGMAMAEVEEDCAMSKEEADRNHEVANTVFAIHNKLTQAILLLAD